MHTIVCKCSRRRDVAGELKGRPLLSAIFTFLDALDLSAAGWSVGPDGRWRCTYCTRRSRLMRAVEGGRREPWPTDADGKTCNVTDPPAPSGASG